MGEIGRRLIVVLGCAAFMAHCGNVSISKGWAGAVPGAAVGKLAESR